MQVASNIATWTLATWFRGQIGELVQQKYTKLQQTTPHFHAHNSYCKTDCAKTDPTTLRNCGTRPHHIRPSSCFTISINSGSLHTNSTYNTSHFEFLQQAITFAILLLWIYLSLLLYYAYTTKLVVCHC